MEDENEPDSTSLSSPATLPPSSSCEGVRDMELISADSELLDRLDEYSSNDNETLANCLEFANSCPTVVHPGLSVTGEKVSGGDKILTPVVLPVLAGMKMVVLPSLPVIAVRCGWYDAEQPCSWDPVEYSRSASARLCWRVRTSSRERERSNARTCAPERIVRGMFASSQKNADNEGIYSIGMYRGVNDW